MLKYIKRLLGEESKKLRMPIFLLTLDTVFNMFFYGMLFMVLLDLMQNSLSQEKLLKYTLIMVGAVIGRLILNIVGYSGIQIRGARATQKLRVLMGDHIRNLNLGYFNKNSIGHLSNIMLSDINDFEKVITHNTSDLIKTVLMTVYLIALTFIIDTQMAVILTIFVVIAMPAIFVGGEKVNEAGEKKKVVMNQVISRMVEYLGGIQVFKSNNLVGERFKRLEDSFRNFKKESIRTEVSMVPYVLIFQIIVDISFPILLLIATFKFGNGSINQREFLTFMIINMALTNILRAFAMQYGSFRYLKLSSKKLVDTYDQPIMPYKYEEVLLPHYDITFNNVSFSYEKGEEVLKDISFEAKTGTMTALIGTSGSGKTTITSLIARFWDIQNGCIAIGGIDIRKIRPDVLLKNISMVFQDVYLIHDTIYNNIRLGNPSASRKEIEEAAKIANCHEFIMKLEKGYEAMVGEGGSTLSGGEKQRISIASAILKNAPIILLDEATASLDADNEYEIRQGIKALTRDKTVIVIAHRLNTIKDADKIIVMHEGRIEEAGRHNELLSNKKRYHHMYTEMEHAKQWAI